MVLRLSHMVGEKSDLVSRPLQSSNQLSLIAVVSTSHKGYDRRTSAIAEHNPSIGFGQKVLTFSGRPCRSQPTLPGLAKV